MPSAGRDEEPEQGTTARLAAGGTANLGGGPDLLCSGFIAFIISRLVLSRLSKIAVMVRSWFIQIARTPKHTY